MVDSPAYAMWCRSMMWTQAQELDALAPLLIAARAIYKDAVTVQHQEDLDGRLLDAFEKAFEALPPELQGLDGFSVAL